MRLIIIINNEEVQVIENSPKSGYKLLETVLSLPLSKVQLIYETQI